MDNNTTTRQSSPVLQKDEQYSAASLVRSFKFINRIDELIELNKPEDEWHILGTSTAWHMFDQTKLRLIALKIYKHPYGCFILDMIMPLNALHFEDFEEMARDWETHDYYLTGRVMEKVYEVAKYCNKKADGQKITKAIANGGSNSWAAINASIVDHY